MIGFIRRKLVMLALVGVILILVAAVAGMALMDSVVKAGVERVGPLITRVPLGVDGVNVSLMRGSFSLTGFRMGNPEGYRAPDSVRVGRMRVDAELRSLLSQQVALHLIEVDRPEITVEFSGGKTNLAAILENVRRPPTREPTDKKLLIGRLHITAPTVHLAGLPMGQTFSITLPDIAIDDLGADGRGLTPAQVAEKVLVVLQEQVLGEISDRLPAEQFDRLVGGGEGALQRGREALEGGRRTIEALGDMLRRGPSQETEQSE